MSDFERLPPPRTHVIFSLFQGDLVNRMFGLVGLHGRRGIDLVLRCIVLIVASWGVVAAAAFFVTNIKGVPTPENFFKDFSAYLQFVIGLPLFVIAEDIVDQHTREAANYFLVSGVIGSSDVPVVENLNRWAEHLRKSWLPEIVCIALAYSLAIVTISPKTRSDCPSWHTTRVPAANQTFDDALNDSRAICFYTLQLREYQRQKDRAAADSTGTLPPAPVPPKDANGKLLTGPVPARLNLAGKLEMLVALPILNYWWLRWMWKIFLWSLYLWRVSRRRLVLTPSHPDATGGLGFISDVQTQFGLAILAYGVSNIASTVGYEVRIEQQPWSLYTVWCPLLLFVIGAPSLFTLPLFMFTKQLYRVKKRALEELYEKTGARARAFEQVWRNSESGASLRSDLVEWEELRHLYDHVESVRIVPFDLRSLGELLGQTLGSLVPLLAYLNPPEALMKFLEPISHIFH